MTTLIPVLLILQSKELFAQWFEQYFGEPWQALNPNLIQLNEDGTGIKIDDVRNLQSLLSYSAANDQKRIVLLHGFESTKPVAQNALLKLLEEPPENTQFILITKNLESILPTVKSRCFVVFENTSSSPQSQTEEPLPFTPEEILQKVKASSVGELLAFSDQFGERPEAILVLESLAHHLHQLLQDKPTRETATHLTAVQTAIRDLQGNINQKLTLDHCWMELAG